MSRVAEHLASGALSGFTSTVFLQPFDFLKTRQQQLHAAARPPVLRLARDVVVAEGPLGLWRGTNASLARNIPGIALYMTGLSQVRSMLARTSMFSAPEGQRRLSTLPTLSHSGNMFAGAATRVAVGILLNPISVLKARYESSLHSLPSLPAAFRDLMRAGPSELTRGLLASSVRDAPYAGLFVLSYEGMKRQTGNALPLLPSSIVHTTSAATAGTLATLATHPFDVIKTKIQVRTEDQYRGFLRTVVAIWKTRGLMGFLDGASLRLSRKILSSAIGWGVYEGVLMLSRRL
ncbi:solute carrier family 25 member 38 [Vararia minispora EC-137]|uniref:Solute carrier family 25 member 38 n=1 Tax=Vararia minispora EC-137 TaxID=1314806 RepID=A0ACB8QD34_9AGAM|nr:solute carrier family 25 member 38 [Vararia minispora EC-137]